MRLHAEAGDGAAMYHLGVCYRLGENGLAEDNAKAFEWYSKAHEAGHESGTASLGACYVPGEGVAKAARFGSVLISEAAHRGSKWACKQLGDYCAYGRNGFPKDIKMARRYYSMVATASVKNIAGEEIEEAAAWLREHPA